MSLNIKLGDRQVSSVNMNKLIHVLYFCTTIILTAQGKSEAEIKQWFVQLGAECAKDYPITLEDMESMNSKHVLPDSDNARCLMACVYRKAKWMDDKGMFDQKAANEMSDLHTDPNKIENSKKLFELCAKVNEETVTDGAKGCQRAGHLFVCLTQNFRKFGFTI